MIAEPALHFGDDERAAAFRAFLERHRGESHLVVLQDFPDPDAIASALAYRGLAGACEIRVDVVYEGRISHQEKLALVHLPDIELTHSSEAGPFGEDRGAGLIDNQGRTTRRPRGHPGAGR